MRLISRIDCAVLFALLLTACVPASRRMLSQHDERIANRLPEQLSRSTVKILTIGIGIDDRGFFLAEGSATGTLFKLEERKGWVLLNRHVAAGEKDTGLKTLTIAVMVDGKRTPAKLERVSEIVDAAVISFNIPDEVSINKLRIIKFARQEPLIGDTVYWMGNPDHAINFFQQGIIAGKCGITMPCLDWRKGTSQWLLDQPVYPGSSGSPVVNHRGQLLGIISSSFGFDLGHHHVPVGLVLAGGSFIGTKSIKVFIKDLLP